MDKPIVVFGIAFILIAGLVISLFLSLDRSSYESDGEIVSMTHVPGGTSISPIIGGDGGFAINSTSDVYSVVVAADNGNVEQVELEIRDFARYRQGDKVHISKIKGSVTISK